MGRADYLADGDWNAICFECGAKRKASTLKRHWQGYYVCPEHWESRHPQDYVRGVAETVAPPWTQPPPDDSFTYTCDLIASLGMAGAGVSGCMVAGNVPRNVSDILQIT